MGARELYKQLNADSWKLLELKHAETDEIAKNEGVTLRPDMTPQETEEYTRKWTLISARVYRNPSEPIRAFERDLTVLLNIAERKIRQEEASIIDGLDGEERLKALIDYYELVPFDKEDKGHENMRTMFYALGIDKIAFDTSPTGGHMLYLSGDKGRLFIAEHQDEILKLLTRTGRKAGRPRKTGREIDLGHNLSLPTLKGYEHSLSTYPEGEAYITKADKDFFDGLEYTGDRLHVKGRPDMPITVQTLKTEEGSSEDMRVLHGLYSAFYKYFLSQKSKGIEILHGYHFFISLPQLADFMGVDLRARKGAQGLFEKIKKYDSYIGIMRNGDLPKVITYSDYIKETNTMVLDVPYFARLIRALEKAAQVTAAGENGKAIDYYNPTHGRLLHGNILNERDAEAEAIIARIEALLMQGPKEVAISFRQLVEEIPQLAYNLKNTTGKNAHDIAVKRNNTLARTFRRVYELLEEKTDMYKYFVNLRVNGMAQGEKKKQLIPTYKYLETKDLKLTLTHEGRNKDYVAG